MSHALTTDAVAPGWRTALPVMVLVLFAILLLFRDTALSMVAIWARSDTYAHGMIVPVISLWLIWRQRTRLARLAPGHSYAAIGLLAVAGFAWLLGDLAAVNVVPQFALVAMLVAAIPVVLGWEVARALAFPLLLLFLAVPFGDFTLPVLMDWTARFTVLALRLSGIPVHAEGMQLTIPSGHWSVVEACSGVRYLIASVTVGTLYAYLSYRTLRRRLLFVVASFLVPIVANWLRAYIIVMLGHLSGNRLAAGVDHLVYGWLFFGVVIMLMFWIGARWREDDSPPVAPVKRSAALPMANPPKAAGTWLAAAATVLVAGLWPLAQWRVDLIAPPPLGDLPALAPITGWEPVTTRINWQPHFENPALRLQAAFQRDGREAGVFLAFYRNQNAQHRLVSSSNVLVKSNDPVWALVSGGSREIAFNSQPLTVRTALLRGANQSRLLVWKWYWVAGRWTASDALAKAYTAWSRLIGRGDDSAAIIFYAVEDRPDEDDRVLADFVRDAAPAIDSALRQASGTR